VVVTVLIIAGVVVVGWSIIAFNRLVRLRNECEQALASIDVQLKRRADLVPNLVETVKGYAAHEKDVFEHVAQARSASLKASGIAEKADADQAFRGALGRLFAVAEAYPQLRAAESFTKLQEALADTEDKIAAARRYYNSVVQRYNSRIESMPTRLVARAGGFTRRELYRIEDDADREPVSVRW
jgi:LemA protein